MTIDQFFAELEGVRDRFEWTLVPAMREVVWERRSKVRLHLRAEIRTGDSETVLDPVGALCYVRTGRIYEPECWADASEDLSMVPSDAAKLHFASSDRTWTGATGHREPVSEMVVLRNRLTESVGLSVTAH